MNDPQLEPDSPADPETSATLWKTKFGNCIEVSYDPFTGRRNRLAILRRYR